MSYEGYTQKLCKNGHLRNIQAFYAETEEELKCDCGEFFVFSHQVDQTNGEGEEYSFVTKTPAMTQKCNLSHIHVVQEATYEIP